MSSAQMSPLAAYHDRLAAGALASDADQSRAAERLDTLSEELGRWNPERWFPKSPTPRGLYLWGPVGRGKSMLMDLFFETAPVKKKRRTHFHEFMLSQHAFMHEARKRASDAGRDDLITATAKNVAEEARLLCFDEVQVTNIADAMILGGVCSRSCSRSMW